MTLILTSPGRYKLFITLAAVLIALDQWTKHLAYHNLMGQAPIDVLPFLQWALVFNRGAAFGFLNDAGGIQHYLFSGLAVIVSVILLVWLWREVARNLLLSWGLTLIFLVTSNWITSGGTLLRSRIFRNSPSVSPSSWTRRRSSVSVLMLFCRLNSALTFS